MSKITVYGATGMVGSAIVREAVARGHSVVGVARRHSEDTGRGGPLREGRDR